MRTIWPTCSKGASDCAWHDELAAGGSGRDNAEVRRDVITMSALERFHRTDTKSLVVEKLLRLRAFRRFVAAGAQAIANAPVNSPVC